LDLLSAKFSVIHTPEQARKQQLRLRSKVIRHDQLGSVENVAGVDVAYDSKRNQACAAAVMLRLPDLELIDSATVCGEISFPYIPGMLSFRETPVMIEALRKLASRPHLIMTDSQGLAHPRRFGSACHLGVLLDLPVIGVAKSRFVGEYQPPPAARSEWTPLEHEGEAVGAVLRTRAGVKPVYVSIGHRISLETAIEFVLRCAPHYRLPEPIRQAHALATRVIRAR